MVSAGMVWLPHKGGKNWRESFKGQRELPTRAQKFHLPPGLSFSFQIEKKRQKQKQNPPLLPTPSLAATTTTTITTTIFRVRPFWKVSSQHVLGACVQIQKTGIIRFRITHARGFVHKYGKAAESA